MTTYAYKVITQTLSVWENRQTGTDAKSLLDRLGAEGWDLVSAVPYKADSVTLFFKRVLETSLRAQIERPVKADPEDRLKKAS